MSALPLSIGCTFSDRIEALLDGRVVPQGCAPTIRCVEPQTLFRQVLREQAFDVAELSMGSHIAAVAAGRTDYVGLPVFLSRSFRHGNLYVRSDRIDRPEALRGAAIGLIDFQQTAALWLRGILADDHGVDRRSVRWVTGGLHVPVADDRVAMTLPEGIDVRRSRETLDRLLATGEIDALISPTAPRCFRAGSAPVARMWPDHRAVERAWWRRHRLFPIMHLLVLRRTLADAHPWLAAALVDAFSRARDLAVRDLVERDFPKVAMPWLADAAIEAQAAVGGDIWHYGVEPNRVVLETMLRHAEADGLTAGRLAPEALFCRSPPG